MKFKKTVGVALATTFLLAACNNDDEHIESYNDGLQQIQKVETPIQDVSQQMQKLESEKEKQMKKISGSNIPDVQDEVQKVLDNDQKIEEQLNKEKNAVQKSKEEFEKIKKESAKIEDEDTKKEFDDFNKAMTNKYEKHEAYLKEYENVLAKEKDLFQYFQGQSGTQDIVDQKSKALADVQKDMSQKVKAYTDAVKKTQREQRDIQQYLNE
ncbi:YkyA family protein [Staphylococcus felis]|uniref:YkyA family protein n=1 Tax=Staphylococcus felis TaxID=46127 RepID=UPI0039675BD4